MLEHVEGLPFLGVRLLADVLVLSQAVRSEPAAAHGTLVTRAGAGACPRARRR